MTHVLNTYTLLFVLIARDFGSNHIAGLELRKEFDMKYVAGYHEDDQFLNSLFLLVKVSSKK
jgi:hypothetical protein